MEYLLSLNQSLFHESFGASDLAQKTWKIIILRWEDIELRMRQWNSFLCRLTEKSSPELINSVLVKSKGVEDWLYDSFAVTQTHRWDAKAAKKVRFPT